MAAPTITDVDDVLLDEASDVIAPTTGDAEIGTAEVSCDGTRTRTGAEGATDESDTVDGELLDDSMMTLVGTRVGVAVGAEDGRSKGRFVGLTEPKGADEGT